MNYQLRDLLREVSENTDDNNYTHATTFGPEAKWYVSNQNMTHLWESYCGLVYKECENEESYYSLAECSSNDMPLIQEFVFKFENDELEDSDLYDENFIYWLCYLYQKLLKDFFNIVDDNQLIVVVLESQNHWIEEDKDKNYLLMKLRLQFPYAKINVNDQDGLIRQEMISLLRKNNVMSKIQQQPIGDWDQMIIKHNKQPVLLYGSQQSKLIPKLKLIHIWSKIDYDSLDKNEELNELDINDVFSVNDHMLVNNGVIDMSLFKPDYEDVYWLPLYLSIHYGTNILLLKNNVKKVTKNDNVDVKNFGQTKNKLEKNDNEGIDFAEQLLRIINPIRFLQEAFWLDIGRALYNTDCKVGLQVWTRFTINACKHLVTLPIFMTKFTFNKDLLNNDIITESCRSHYDSFGNTNITVKTLGCYAREDNKEEYKNWHNKWVLEAMEDALCCTDTKVCKALYRLYWLDFIYDNDNKKWYYHHFGWTETSEGNLLRKAISNVFMKKFEEIRLEILNQRKDSDDETMRSNLDVTRKKLDYLIQKLETGPFKTRLMIEAKEFFGFDRFTQLLNKNKELTGLKNGVLEVIGNDIIFRKSKQEDYISMKAGCGYHSYYHWKHPLVVETMKWMGETFEEDLMDHVLKLFSSGFIGKNMDKIFPILTGSGNNSKSMIIKLLEITFGDYLVKIPVSLLSEKEGSSGNATPQIAQMKDCRWAVCDEADNTQVLKKNSIKKITGNDSFHCRSLYQNSTKLELTITPIVVSNDIPSLIDSDQPTRDRIRIIPFLRKWVPSPEEYKQLHPDVICFKIDTNFDKKIPIYSSAFLWILTQYFPKYCSKGLESPPSVIQYTEEYWKNNDVYGLFISEKVVEVYLDNTNQLDTSCTITMTELVTEFKLFFRNSYPSENPPNRDIIRINFVNRWGPYPARGWVGKSLIGGVNDNMIAPFQPTKMF